MFDIFFKEFLKQRNNEVGTSYISEGQFAELIADCELKLIESNGAYRFVDSDGSGNQRESAENSIVHHFDGDITGLSSLI